MADLGEPDLSEVQDDKSEEQDKKPKKLKKPKKKKKTKNQEDSEVQDEDQELSELLESALEDFGPSLKSNSEEDEDQEDKEVACSGGSSGEKKVTPPKSLWDEEFLKQAAERFQQTFESGFSAGDTPLTAEQLGQNIQSLAEAVTQMAGSEASPDMEFSNFFAQALKQLSETPEQSRKQLNEDELKKLMTNLGSFLESPEFADIFPLIFSMMQNLLSKDVLYNDIKGITEKYPQWLEENKSKLPSHEYERHTKKLELLKEVCSELEKETPGDSEEIKKTRCDRVLSLILQVQDLGLMPSEIAGDLTPMLGLDGQEYPQVPSNVSPNQCNMI